MVSLLPQIFEILFQAKNVVSLLLQMFKTQFQATNVVSLLLQIFKINVIEPHDERRVITHDKLGQMHVQMVKIDF